MAYTKIGWVNDETELSAENFNHIEDGIANAYNVPLIAVVDTAPTTCSTGDKYYNTTTKKIYTATATNTWSTTGEDPEADILYVVFEEKNTYTYDGTDLISVGGGSSDIIVVGSTEPTEDTKLQIESFDLDAQYEITEDTYSTSEIKTNKIWIDGKPIYRKTITWSTPSSEISSWTSIELISSSLDKVINAYGSTSKGNFLPRYESANYYMIFSTYDTNYLYYKQKGYNSQSCWMTIEYTKTS